MVGNCFLSGYGIERSLKSDSIVLVCGFRNPTEKIVAISILIALDISMFKKPVLVGLHGVYFRDDRSTKKTSESSDGESEEGILFIVGNLEFLM